jgi:hypothetical protein
MSDPFVDALKGGINTASELITVADDLEKVAQQVADLGKKERIARSAWRHKKAIVNGDWAYVDAVEEWKRVKEALDAKEEVRKHVVAKWGKAAWDEILLIEARQKDDRARLFTEDGYDREKMNQLKWGCFGAALLVTMILWATGVISEMAIAFYGE